MTKAKTSKNKKAHVKHMRSISVWPLVIGLGAFFPVAMVAILGVLSVYLMYLENPQKQLLGLEFSNYDENKAIVEVFLENGDIDLAKVIYSKTIDGYNLNTRSAMSAPWVDSMILDLDPKSELIEDIKTKTLMSEAVKSKSLYMRTAKLLRQLGLVKMAEDFEIKALEIDPVD